MATGIAGARKDAGLLQEELGRRVGRDQTWISNIETGQRRVDVLELYVLAKAMGVEPVDLFARITKGIPEGFTI